MISATANHLARKVSSSKKFSSILTETFNRPAFNVGQIFQPFDPYGRSLYSKLVKRDGEKKIPIPVVKLFGMIQMVIFNQPKYQSHGIGNGNTNKGIVAGEVIFYGHK